MKSCKTCGIKFRPYNSLQPYCSFKCSKVKKEKPKPVNLKSQARAAFQKWIRNRDKNQPCISCGSKSGIWHAGHYLKAELYTGLIFEEDNCHKQCEYCNIILDGNPEEYRKGLINRIGLQRVIALEASKDTNRFSTINYPEILNKYKK